jgi:hypothetical protein
MAALLAADSWLAPIRRPLGWRFGGKRAPRDSPRGRRDKQPTCQPGCAALKPPDGMQIRRSAGPADARPYRYDIEPNIRPAEAEDRTLRARSTIIESIDGVERASRFALIGIFVGVLTHLFADDAYGAGSSAADMSVPNSLNTWQG